MRRHRLLRKAPPFTKNEGTDNRGSTGTDVHDGTTGEIHQTQLAEPATAPHPVTQWCIDQQCPRSTEKEDRRETHSFGEPTNDEGGSNDGERELEERERRLGNSPPQAVFADSIHEYLAETADDSVTLVIECQAVANYHPEDRDHAGQRKTLHEHTQDILAAHQATVKQRQARNGHEQNQRRRRKNPGGVSLIQHILGERRW